MEQRKSYLDATGENSSKQPFILQTLFVNNWFHFSKARFVLPDRQRAVTPRDGSVLRPAVYPCLNYSWY